MMYTEYHMDFVVVVVDMFDHENHLKKLCMKIDTNM